MLKTIRWLLVILAMPLSLVAQQVKTGPERPVTGLHVLSAVLNRATHQIDVQLHNTTNNKTVVGHVLLVKGFDRDGKPLEEPGRESGYAVDFVDPNNQNSTRGYILAGDVGSATVPADPRALNVEVSVLGVVYLDRTFEGAAAAGTIFYSRKQEAKSRREEASTAEGTRKKELEKQAEWLEEQSQPIEEKGEKK